MVVGHVPVHTSPGATRRRSFLWRIMGVAFAAVHVPLVTLAIFMAINPGASRWTMLAMVLVATLCGTAFLLLVLARWLGPLQTATDHLHDFLDSGELHTGGPYPHSELGTLLQDIDQVSTELAAQRDAALADASVDPVTRVASRRASQNLLNKIVVGPSPVAEKLSVVIADVDAFKDVNDRRGHPFGDHVLRLVATTLCELRGVEHVGRWGGDEFLVVIRAGPDEATGAIDRARELIATRSEAAGERVTISAGIAPLSEGMDPALAVQAADNAAYAAKHAGRDRVMTATTGPATPSNATTPNDPTPNDPTPNDPTPNTTASDITANGSSNGAPDIEPTAPDVPVT